MKGRKKSKSVARRGGFKRQRGFLSRGAGESVLRMLKGAGIGGAGAIVLDVVMGYAGPLLPASVSARVNTADGSINVMYYGVKGALAVAAGVLGGSMMPAHRDIAEKAAEGALTVMSYEVLRLGMASNLPSVPLGYMNPGQILRGVKGGTGVARIVNRPENFGGGMGRVVQMQNSSINQAVRVLQPQMLRGARRF